MGLTQDLEVIRETTAAILDECNAVAKLIPADNLSDVPRLITEAEQVGYTEGEQVGHNNGYEYGVGDTQATILQHCNPVIEKYTTPADIVDELPAKIDEVYNVGVNAGGGGSYDEGYGDGLSDGRNEGLDLGKQAAYDEFWDEYQNNGARTDYRFAFAGIGWTINNCKPKYDIQPTNAERMFATPANINGDIDKILGVTLDFSKCTNMAYTFYQLGNSSNTASTLGIIDLSVATDVTSVFNGTGIQTIRGLVPPTIDMAAICFQVGLRNLTVTGVFTANVNLSRCSNLTRASIESVVSALGDTSNGKTLTLKQSAVNAAFTTEEWETLAATKPNWTITLSA